MVRVLLFIVVLVFVSGVKAQEWFPVGASWYYNQIIFFEGETYRYFEVTGDTILQGKTCKEISGYCDCSGSGGRNYFYQEGDKIFEFDSEADTFRILYDFTLLPGDTLTYRGDPSLAGDGYFLIDSITIMQVGSQNLRVQHITSLYYAYEWGRKIIERIGSNGCLYPTISFCDPATSGLRCYEDDEIGLFNFQIPPRPCHYISVSVDDPSVLPVVKIYPNPATNVVHIQSEKPIETLTLYNNLGILVYQQSSILSAEFEFDIHSLPEGVYRIQAVLSNHEVVYQSMVIQR